MMIETARLRLRLFRPDDLDDYHAQIYSDPDVTRFLPGGQPRPKERTQATLEFSLEHAAKHGFTLWAAELKDSGVFVGHCGLVYLQSAPEVELAYAFGKAYWGQGYATEGARASLRYGFESAGLERILALADLENWASQKVMRKIGMTYLGTTDRYYNTTLALYVQERAIYQPDESPYQVKVVH